MTAVRAKTGGAPGRGQGVEVGAPSRAFAARKPARGGGEVGGVGEAPRDRLGGGGAAEHHQRVVHLVDAGGAGPCLLPDPVDRAPVQPPDVGGGLRIESPAHRHRPGAAFLQRRIVEERVRTGVEHLRRERRGLGEVAGDDSNLAGREARHQGFEPVDVHRLGQRVGDRLLHQGVIGDLAGAREVLDARDLVREHRGDEILGLHALDVRRNLAAAAKARDRERDVRVPPPAHVEHRRVEQRLGEDVAHRFRREVAAHLLEREAVGLAEREHDGVLGGRGLELEVELAAEPLAQREAPRAVEPAAEPRMDDELHAAALVEEPFQHHRVPVRQRAERGVGGAEVVDYLLGGAGSDPGAIRELAREPAAGFGRGGLGPGRLEPLREPAEQGADAVGDLLGAPGRLAEPEREVRRLAVRVLDPHRAALHAQDAP